MTDSLSSSVFRPQIPGFTPAPQQVPENRFAEEALERHKREGMELAVRVRLVAMSTIAVMILFLTPWPAVLYYEVILAIFIGIGLLQRRVATVGQNSWEMVLLFCDLALLTLICVAPNPFDDRSFPLGFQYRFETFLYFFVILAGATLAYSWRTVVAVGTWTAGFWTVAALAVWALREDTSAGRAAVMALYPDNLTMAHILDPGELLIDIRIQEIVVFLLVAATLALSVRRSNMLLLRQAGLERERANLARYFSPNVVDRLSQNDEPLKQVREQDVAVLFVDIVGFTAFADRRTPQQVIDTLRAFHGRMEGEVFRQHGTLDKYLGDGLMATFGTPVAGPADATASLACARGMTAALDAWNAEREAAGEPALRVGIGIHFGPVVLGDIGANRLEFAAIGSTVNIASRLEALTRTLGARIAISDTVAERARAEGAEGADLLAGFRRVDGQEIRGVKGALTIWCGD